MCVEFAMLKKHANHWEDQNKGVEFQRELDDSFFGEGLKYFWFAKYINWSFYNVGLRA